MGSGAKGAALAAMTLGSEAGTQRPSTSSATSNGHKHCKKVDRRCARKFRKCSAASKEQLMKGSKERSVGTQQTSRALQSITASSRDTRKMRVAAPQRSHWSGSAARDMLPHHGPRSFRNWFTECFCSRLLCSQYCRWARGRRARSRVISRANYRARYHPIRMPLCCAECDLTNYI